MSRLLVILLVLTAAVANAASLDFTFASSLLYTQAGVPVTFVGTVTNAGATTVYINGDNVTSALPFDDTAFLLGAPLSLDPAESFAGPLFDVLPGPGTPVGLYPGVFSILGGDSPGSFDVVSSAPFAVQVQIVPEPGTWIGAFPLVAVFLARRRFRT